LEPIALQEREIVNLTVSNGPGLPDDLLDTEFLRDYQDLADDTVTIEEVRAALSKIPGSMADEVIKERNDRV
jgi:hypothetical protein